MTTTDKNAEIALWMGAKQYTSYFKFGAKTHPEIFDFGNGKTFKQRQLKYHSDWNWLCLVIEKIRDFGYNVRFDMEDYFVMDNEGCDITVEGTSSGNSWIEGTFNIVYQFVVWHNQQ